MHQEMHFWQLQSLGERFTKSSIPDLHFGQQLAVEYHTLTAPRGFDGHQAQIRIACLERIAPVLSSVDGTALSRVPNGGASSYVPASRA